MDSSPTQHDRKPLLSSMGGGGGDREQTTNQSKPRCVYPKIILIQIDHTSQNNSLLILFSLPHENFSQLMNTLAN